MRFVLLGLASLFVVSISLTAQPTKFRIEFLDPPDSRVVAIEQDTLGFMWFGTKDGLYRYDGYTYTAYRYNPFDSTSVVSSTIEELLVDSRGNLWVGAIGGLDRYDPETDSFIHYRTESGNQQGLCSAAIHSLFETNDGTIWVGSVSGGLSRYNHSEDAFQCFRINSDSGGGLSGQSVFTIYEDQRGTLWVTTHHAFNEDIRDEGGLCRFERETEQFTCYRHDPDDERSLINNNVLSVFEDSKGNFWVGTMGDGLHLMDRESGTFTRYSHNPDHPEWLSAPLSGEYNFSAVILIHEDRDGLLWIGGTGLHVYDRASGIQTRVEGMSWVWEIFEDRTGNLWIGGASEGGLGRLVSAPELFRVESLERSLSLHVSDQDSILWIGSFGNGIVALDHKGNSLIHTIPEDSSGVRAFNIGDLYEDREGSIWATTGNSGNAVYRYDDITSIERGIVAESISVKSTRTEIPWSNAVVEDSKGRIWVGTYGNGLYQLDREGRIVRQFRHDPSLSESLGNNYIYTFYEDSSGFLWVGTTLGLSRFDPELGIFTNYAPPGMVMVFAIREDSKGRFWVGSEGGGIHLFDRGTGSSIPFTTQQGLVNNGVQEVLIDGAGALWIGTEKGLSRFNPETQLFTTYTIADGLPSDIFTERAGTIGPDGRLFFGTEEGIVSFSPAQFSSTEFRPPTPRLTEFRIANEIVAVGSDTPLKTPISMVKEITLTHKQRDFGFTYAGLYPQAQSSVQYAYKLEDYDEDWQQVGTQRQAFYTNIEPGTYIFQVKAATQGGVWSEDNPSLHITMTSPWWHTWWAYLVYGLLFITGIVAADRIQRRRLIEKEREKTRERELAQAKEIERAYTQLKATQQQLIQQEKMASLGQLTSGIAHEIKNPLNFVNNFADLNEELASELEAELQANPDKTVAELREQLFDLTGGLKANARQISKHGKRADNIVKSMMQHAGGEGERYEVAVNSLVDEMINITYKSLQAQRPDLKVNIEKNLDASVGSLTLSPQGIGRVLQNILGNAIEAVHEKKGLVDETYDPRIVVMTRRENGEVGISVRDNGLGIPQESLKKIFEPFFTTKPTGSGTGLGLSLSYDIVTRGHGGQLEVVSTEGEGTTFLISLPISKE